MNSNSLLAFAYRLSFLPHIISLPVDTCTCTSDSVAMNFTIFVKGFMMSILIRWQIAPRQAWQQKRRFLKNLPLCIFAPPLTRGPMGGMVIMFTVQISLTQRCFKLKLVTMGLVVSKKKLLAYYYAWISYCDVDKLYICYKI